MQPHKFIIGVLLFSVFIYGGIFVMYGTIDDPQDGLLEEYDVPKDSYASKLENITKPEVVTDEVKNITSDQKEDLKEEIDREQEWNPVEIGPIRAMIRMYNFFKSVNVLIEEVALLIHIPTFFIKTAVTIVLITVVFMGLYFLRRFQLRND